LFETTIDFILVSEIYKCRPADIKAKNLIIVDGIESHAIEGMYRTVLKSALGIEIGEGQIQKAIKDMGIAVSVLRDRTGLKKKLLSGIETGLGRYPILSSMIYPSKLTDNLDYLNRQHSTWSHPCNIEITSNSSFDELLESAALEAVKMYDAIYGCITGDVSIKDSLDIIGNLSFSTGMDCTSDMEFKYYDCIYE
jgi:hypothetical protein